MRIRINFAIRRSKISRVKGLTKYIGKYPMKQFKYLRPDFYYMHIYIYCL